MDRQKNKVDGEQVWHAIQSIALIRNSAKLPPRCLFLAASMLSILSVIHVRGWCDTEARQATYYIVTSDGQYMFVMLSPDSKIDEAITPLDKRDDAIRIRRKYQSSGLYPNDGSTIPLWKVNWYAHQVFISSDGRYIVRQGPWATSGSDEAITFFDRGEIIRSYQIKDLVSFIWFLPQTASHFTWLESIFIDDDQKILVLTTKHKDKYSFNIITGEIISTRKMTSYLIYGACALFIFLMVILARRKWRR